MSGRSVIVGIICSLACAACAATDERSGSLDFGGDAGELCFPSARANEYTHGFDAVTNRGTQDVTIRAVRLVGAKNIALVGSFLAPIEDRTVIGVQAGWPPPEVADSLVWRAKVPAVGSRLKRGDDHQLNLLLDLRASSEEAGFEAIELQYSTGLRRYAARSSTRLVIKPKCF